MIKRSADCIVEGRVSSGALISCINTHIAACTRLDKLHDYMENKHEISERVKAENRPNNKLVHSFPRYITTMAAGYLIGSPVSYADEKQEQALKVITEQYSRVNVQASDMELARDASTYGRAVEILYADKSAKPRCAPLDPRSAFVVYDDTVEGCADFRHPLLPKDQ